MKVYVVTVDAYETEVMGVYKSLGAARAATLVSVQAEGGNPLAWLESWEEARAAHGEEHGAYYNITEIELTP